MSSANADVLRRVFEAWNAGDMNAVRDLFDPEAEMYAPEGWPEPGPEIGRDAVMRQFERLRETWDSDSVETVGDYVELGDQVLVRIVWKTVGHGPASPVEFTQRSTVRDGRIVRNEYHWDHGQALEAAREEARSSAQVRARSRS